MLRINELHPALRRVDGCICGVNLGRTLQTHRLTGGWHFSHEGFRRLPVGRPWTVSTPLPRTLCWHKSVHQTTAELNDNARGKCIEAAAELSTPYTQTGASPDFFSCWPSLVSQRNPGYCARALTKFCFPRSAHMSCGTRKTTGPMGRGAQDGLPTRTQPLTV